MWFHEIPLQVGVWKAYHFKTIVRSMVISVLSAGGRKLGITEFGERKKLKYHYTKEKEFLSFPESL